MRKATRRTPSRVWQWAVKGLAVGAVVVGLGACGGGISTRSNTGSSGIATSPTGVLAPAQAPGIASNGAKDTGRGGNAGGGSYLSTGSGSSSTIPTVANELRPLLIKNASLTLEVKDPIAAMSTVQDLARQADPFSFTSNSTVRVDGQQTYITLSIQVRADNFDEALNRMRSAGKVLNLAVSTQEVTQEYVDLKSRLNNLKIEQVRLQSLMKQAQNLSDTLVLQDKLTEVEGQIEQVEGRLNYLSNKTSFSSISIILQPVPPLIKPAPNPGWNPLLTFRQALASLGVNLQGLVDLLVWVVVYSIVFLPLAFLARYVWRQIRHRWVVDEP